MNAITPKGSPDSPGSGKRMKFPRSARLLRRADFERVYKQGRRHFSQHMTVFYLQRAQDEGLRVGFTVSRMLGGAVQRNRMKRRLREAVRLEAAWNCAGVDVVINPKKSVATADVGVLRAEISRAFDAIRKSVDR